MTDTISLLARPLQGLYMAGLNGHRALYRHQFLRRNKLPGVTVSVGNVALGGTGKSPVVIELVRYLVKHGHHPAVLTRGYRSGLKAGQSLVYLAGKAQGTADENLAVYPDEARMQSNALPTTPIIVGSDRHGAAQAYLEQASPPSHWILDDGFQHWALERDIDILLLDAQDPFPDGRVLPFGRFRESDAAISRANAVLFTRANGSFPRREALERVEKLGIDAFPIEFREATPEIVTGTSERGSHVDEDFALVTAIAGPGRFVAAAEQMGLSVRHKLIERDHSRFDQQSIREAAKKCSAFLTTAKDFWRDPSAFIRQDLPTYVLPLSIFGCDQAFDSILSNR